MAIRPVRRGRQTDRHEKIDPAKTAPRWMYEDAKRQARIARGEPAGPPIERRDGDDERVAVPQWAADWITERVTGMMRKHGWQHRLVVEPGEEPEMMWCTPGWKGGRSGRSAGHERRPAAGQVVGLLPSVGGGDRQRAGMDRSTRAVQRGRRCRSELGAGRGVEVAR